MKQLAALAFFILLAASAPVLPSGQNVFSGGDGTSANPYQITNAVQLQAMNSSLSASYILMNDIDCSDTINWNAGAGFVPIGSSAAGFVGFLDGQSHKITGLYINRPAQGEVGLFGYLSYAVYYYGAVISNVGLVDADITGGSSVGGLVGHMHYTTTVESSYVTGRVSGASSVGGLVGNNWFGTIAYSCSAAEVSGNVTVGGITGSNNGGMTNCYATGRVTGTSYVGGLAADISYGSIRNSYAAGTVTGVSYVGGIVGYLKLPSPYFGMEPVINSFWDVQATGQPTSPGGTGRTTAEMKQQATFPDWDFIDHWRIQEGSGYPYLFWQNSPIGIDDIPPVIAAHEDVFAEAASPAGAVVGYVLPAATDNVDADVTVIGAPASGSTFALGDTTVTCTAVDAAGNQAIPTSFVVHVADTTPPVPDAASLPAISAPCSITVTTIPTATDLCDGQRLGTTNDPLQYASQGTYTIHWRFADLAGNASTQDQSVVVRDTIAPAITVSAPVCAPFGNGRKVNKLIVTALDNCSPAVIPRVTGVEVFNNGGHPVAGKGLYEIMGNIVIVNPNGNGWSVKITAIAADDCGNTQTIQVTKTLSKCQ
jgi:hypothetical protein